MGPPVRSRTSQKEVKRMSRKYEVMYIVRPDVEEADLDKLIEGFEKNVDQVAELEKRLGIYDLTHFTPQV